MSNLQKGRPPLSSSPGRQEENGSPPRTVPAPRPGISESPEPSHGLLSVQNMLPSDCWLTPPPVAPDLSALQTTRGPPQPRSETSLGTPKTVQKDSPSGGTKIQNGTLKTMPERPKASQSSLSPPYFTPQRGSPETTEQSSTSSSDGSQNRPPSNAICHESQPCLLKKDATGSSSSANPTNLLNLLKTLEQWRDEAEISQYIHHLSSSQLHIRPESEWRLPMSKLSPERRQLIFDIFEIIILERALTDAKGLIVTEEFTEFQVKRLNDVIELATGAPGGSDSEAVGKRQEALEESLLMIRKDAREHSDHRTKLTEMLEQHMTRFRREGVAVWQLRDGKKSAEDAQDPELAEQQILAILSQLFGTSQVAQAPEDAPTQQPSTSSAPQVPQEDKSLVVARILAEAKVKLKNAEAAAKKRATRDKKKAEKEEQNRQAETSAAQIAQLMQHLAQPRPAQPITRDIEQLHTMLLAFTHETLRLIPGSFDRVREVFALRLRHYLTLLDHRNLIRVEHRENVRGTTKPWTRRAQQLANVAISPQQLGEICGWILMEFQSLEQNRQKYADLGRSVERREIEATPALSNLLRMEQRIADMFLTSQQDFEVQTRARAPAQAQARAQGQVQAPTPAFAPAAPQPPAQPQPSRKRRKDEHPCRIPQDHEEEEQQQPSTSQQARMDQQAWTARQAQMAPGPSNQIPRIQYTPQVAPQMLFTPQMAQFAWMAQLAQMGQNLGLLAQAAPQFASQMAQFHQNAMNQRFQGAPGTQMGQQMGPSSHISGVSHGQNAHMTQPPQNLLFPVHTIQPPAPQGQMAEQPRRLAKAPRIQEPEDAPGRQTPSTSEQARMARQAPMTQQPGPSSQIPRIQGAPGFQMAQNSRPLIQQPGPSSQIPRIQQPQGSPQAAPRSRMALDPRPSSAPEASSQMSQQDTPGLPRFRLAGGPPQQGQGAPQVAPQNPRTSQATQNRQAPQGVSQYRLPVHTLPMPLTSQQARMALNPRPSSGIPQHGVPLMGRKKRASSPAPFAPVLPSTSQQAPMAQNPRPPSVQPPRNQGAPTPQHFVPRWQRKKPASRQAPSTPAPWFHSVGGVQHVIPEGNRLVTPTFGDVPQNSQQDSVKAKKAPAAKPKGVPARPEDPPGPSNQIPRVQQERQIAPNWIPPAVETEQPGPSQQPPRLRQDSPQAKPRPVKEDQPDGSQSLATAQVDPPSPQYTDPNQLNQMQKQEQSIQHFLHMSNRMIAKYAELDTMMQRGQMTVDQMTEEAERHFRRGSHYYSHNPAPSPEHVKLIRQSTRQFLENPARTEWTPEQSTVAFNRVIAEVHAGLTADGGQEPGPASQRISQDAPAPEDQRQLAPNWIPPATEESRQTSQTMSRLVKTEQPGPSQQPPKPQKDARQAKPRPVKKEQPGASKQPQMVQQGPPHGQRRIAPDRIPSATEEYRQTPQAMSRPVKKEQSGPSDQPQMAQQAPPQDQRQLAPNWKPRPAKTEQPGASQQTPTPQQADTPSTSVSSNQTTVPNRVITMQEQETFARLVLDESNIMLAHYAEFEIMMQNEEITDGQVAHEMTRYWREMSELFPDYPMATAPQAEVLKRLALQFLESDEWTLDESSDAVCQFVRAIQAVLNAEQQGQNGQQRRQKPATSPGPSRQVSRTSQGVQEQRIASNWIPPDDEQAPGPSSRQVVLPPKEAKKLETTINETMGSAILGRHSNLEMLVEQGNVTEKQAIRVMKNANLSHWPRIPGSLNTAKVPRVKRAKRAQGNKKQVPTIQQVPEAPQEEAPPPQDVQELPPAQNTPKVSSASQVQRVLGNQNQAPPQQEQPPIQQVLEAPQKEEAPPLEDVQELPPTQNAPQVPSQMYPSHWPRVQGARVMTISPAAVPRVKRKRRKRAEESQKQVTPLQDFQELPPAQQVTEAQPQEVQESRNGLQVSSASQDQRPLGNQDLPPAQHVTEMSFQIETSHSSTIQGAPEVLQNVEEPPPTQHVPDPQPQDVQEPPPIQIAPQIPSLDTQQPHPLQDLTTRLSLSYFDSQSFFELRLKRGEITPDQYVTELLSAWNRLVDELQNALKFESREQAEASLQRRVGEVRNQIIVQLARMVRGGDSVAQPSTENVAMVQQEAQSQRPQEVHEQVQETHSEAPPLQVQDVQPPIQEVPEAEQPEQPPAESIENLKKHLSILYLQTFSDLQKLAKQGGWTNEQFVIQLSTVWNYMLDDLARHPSMRSQTRQQLEAILQEAVKKLEFELTRDHEARQGALDQVSPEEPTQPAPVDVPVSQPFQDGQEVQEPAPIPSMDLPPQNDVTPQDPPPPPPTRRERYNPYDRTRAAESAREYERRQISIIRQQQQSAPPPQPEAAPKKDSPRVPAPLTPTQAGLRDMLQASLLDAFHRTEDANRQQTLRQYHELAQNNPSGVLAFLSQTVPELIPAEVYEKRNVVLDTTPKVPHPPAKAWKARQPKPKPAADTAPERPAEVSLPMTSEAPAQPGVQTAPLNTASNMNAFADAFYRKESKKKIPVVDDSKNNIWKSIHDDYVRQPEQPERHLAGSVEPEQHEPMILDDQPMSPPPNHTEEDAMVFSPEAQDVHMEQSESSKKPEPSNPQPAGLKVLKRQRILSIPGSCPAPLKMQDCKRSPLHPVVDNHQNGMSIQAASRPLSRSSQHENRGAHVSPIKPIPGMVQSRRRPGGQEALADCTSPVERKPFAMMMSRSLIDVKPLLDRVEPTPPSPPPPPPPPPRFTREQQFLIGELQNTVTQSGYGGADFVEAVYQVTNHLSNHPNATEADIFEMLAEHFSKFEGAQHPPR